MKKDRMRRLLCFPLEERFRAHVEQDIAHATYPVSLVAAVFILISQGAMMILSLLRNGGPFAALRRQGYWWAYVGLFCITLLALASMLFLHRRAPSRAIAFYLRLQAVYAAFIEIWAICITLLDQFGGNSLSVFTYVSLSVAALTVLRPWQSLLIFSSATLLINLLLPLTPSGPENFYSNSVNTIFIAVMSFLISFVLYRNRVRNSYDQMVIERQNVEILEMNRKLNQLALTDGLTGMNNRRYLDHLAATPRWQAAEPVSAIMLDIDYFKQYNDANGHIAGDACLIAIAGVIHSTLQGCDGAAIRLGGEEFFVCLFDMQPSMVSETAENLRLAIASCELPQADATTRHITVSVGVSMGGPGSAFSLHELLVRADKALYAAKRQGRNRVAIYEPNSAQ